MGPGRTLALGLGLVIGGALGNLIDRLVYGRVADFFHFYGFGYDWYVFNVADAAITSASSACYTTAAEARHAERRGPRRQGVTHELSSSP